MKQRLCMCIFLALLLPMLMTPVFADTGPKPSVVVDISGVEGQYYATLLAEETTTGPWSVSDGLYDPEGERTAIWQKFHDYSDPDGYHFLGCFAEVEDGAFCWGYYPPERFKLLLYFPETDSFLACDEIMEQYAFDSYFEAELTPDGMLNVQRSHGVFPQILAFLFRLVLTVAIEVALALIVGFRRKQLLVILNVNVITQLGLNLWILIGGFEPSILVYILQYAGAELLVFLFEALAYSLLLPKLEPTKLPKQLPVIYAALANFCSFLVGYWISIPLTQFF